MIFYYKIDVLIILTHNYFIKDRSGLVYISILLNRVTVFHELRNGLSKNNVNAKEFIFLRRILEYTIFIEVYFCGNSVNHVNMTLLIKQNENLAKKFNSFELLQN